MRQTWTTLTLLHWSYPPDVVQRLLPDGLTVETREAAAWVGLVPFRITVRGPVGPAPPWLRAIPETNARTYVTGPDGRPGVWFFSLDIASPDAVVAARSTWGLPYFWSRMSVTEEGDEVRYRCRRRPGQRPATSDVSVRVGTAIPPVELTEFDHFLTARFGLWSRAYGALTFTQAEHPPWELSRAIVTRCDDRLVTAAGLPAPSGEPVAHFSRGVTVRIGALHPVKTGPGDHDRGR